MTNKIQENSNKVKVSQQNIQKWIKKKNEDSLRDLWENIKHTNICVRRAPKREVRREVKDTGPGASKVILSAQPNDL